MKKLGVIVPYRDRRSQLSTFKEHIEQFLTNQNIEYILIVAEQDEDRPFNRGLLLNWGFRKAETLGCDYVVFHDVDMLPIKSDYSYSPYPVHLVTELITPDDTTRTLFYDYFGGVTLFPVDVFKEINGYSNDYWAWGFEDDDLFLRCRENNVPLNILKIPSMSRKGSGLSFNGVDSYILLKRTFSNHRSFALAGTFTVNSLDINLDQEYDEMSIFSIPGFDTSLSYRSFMNFSLQFWDNELKSHSIFSTKYPFGSYNFTVNFLITEKPKITLYINGEKIGSKTVDSFDLKKTILTLGAGNPERTDNPNYFKGILHDFAIFNTVLTEEEVQEINDNKYHSYFNLSSNKKLKHYYDCKFVRNNQLIDLVDKNHGIVKNCKSIITEHKDTNEVPIPHRREGTFQVLAHKENGFTDTWADWASRTNQSKYFSKLNKSDSNYSNDGLNQDWGYIHREVITDKYVHLYIKT